MRCARFTLIAFALVTAPVDGRAEEDVRTIAERHAAAERCLADALDDLASPSRAVSVDCPALYTHAEDHRFTQLLRLGEGTDLAVHTESHAPCGGGQDSWGWLTPSEPLPELVRQQSFLPLDRDTDRDVVYGLVTASVGVEGHPLPAARFSTRTGRLDRLGPSCIGLFVVQEAGVWLCERGDGGVEVGALDESASAPAAYGPPADVRLPSLTDLVESGYPLGRGFVLVRVVDEHAPTVVRHRIVHVGAEDDERRSTSFTPDVTRPGALVDAAHLVGGPFLWFRQAFVRYALRHGLLAAADSLVPRGLVVVGAGGGAVVSTSAAAALEPVRDALGLGPSHRDELILGAMWADSDGRLIGPIDGWAGRLEARGLPRPSAIEFGVRTADARFRVSMVVHAAPRETMTRFVPLFARADADAYVERVDASRTRVTFLFDAVELPRWLASDLPVPRDPAIARILDASTVRGARAHSAWARRTTRACEAPLDAWLSGDFEALVAIDTEWDDCTSLFDAIDEPRLARGFSRARAACRAQDDAACRLLMDADDESVLPGHATWDACEREGGALCRALAGSLVQLARVEARIESDCRRGSARDCRALLDRARIAEEASSRIEELEEAACTAGDADACTDVAERMRRACEDATRCDEPVQRMVHACATGSDRACDTLRSDVRWVRLVGNAPVTERRLRIHRASPP